MNFQNTFLSFVDFKQLGNAILAVLSYNLHKKVFLFCLNFAKHKSKRNVLKCPRDFLREMHVDNLT